MQAQQIGERLREWLRSRLGAPALELASPLEERVDGFETRVFFVDLSGAPDELSRPLALRLYAKHDSPRRARLEATVQRAVASQGYPAPQPRLVCEESEPLGAPFLLMDRLPGRGLGVLPFEMRLTAEWMSRLHALPTEPVARALEDAGLSADALRLSTRLDELAQDVERAALVGLAAATRWLRDNRPEPGPEVLCHGDLMMNNLLREGRRLRGVIDWSAGRVALCERELDVATTAVTWLAFQPAQPRPVRFAVNRTLRLLADVFLRACRRAEPLDEERLRYYALWRCQQILVSTELLAAGAPGRMRADNPHNMLTARTVREGYAAFFTAQSGVPVTLWPG